MATTVARRRPLGTLEDEPPPRAPGVERLKPNAVGLMGVIFMAVATAAPITAMTGNVPFAVGFGNGIGAPAGFMFATVVLTIFSVGYVAMARHITATGAFYGFISHGLGRTVGMASGLLAVLAYVVFEASLIGIFAYFADTTFQAQLGVNIGWIWFALLALAANAALAYFDIGLTAKVLGVLLITEISVLAIMAFSVLFAGGGPDGLTTEPINPVNAFKGVGLQTAAVGLGMFMAFWSWVGFESTAMYGEESRNPRRNVPLATLLAVTGIGVFYVFVSWMAIAGTGLSESITVSQENGLELFFGPTREFAGQFFVDAFQWLLITGAFACGMAFHNCAARYLYAMGREGYIWKGLGRTHTRHGTPHFASFVQTGIATAIVLSFLAFGQDPYLGLYVLMAILGTFAILIVQTLASFSVIGYFHVQKHHPETASWWRTLLFPLVGGIGMLVVVYLLIDNLTAAAGDASSALIFKLTPWIVLATFLLGIGLALFMRARRPDRYAVIGRTILDHPGDRPGVDEPGDGSVTEATVPTRAGR